MSQAIGMHDLGMGWRVMNCQCNAKLEEFTRNITFVPLFQIAALPEGI